MLTPAEASLLSEAVRAQMAEKQGDKKASLEILDGLLAKDLEPTRFRGFVQMLRSVVLLDNDRNSESIAAADEAVRLLPGYSGPLITASYAYAYSNRAGEGADFLLRASQIDPDIVRDRLDDYEVTNLMHRLDAARDERRSQALSDRLLAIGWRGQELDSRSNLAVAAIKLHLGRGDAAGARALIPEVLVPSQTYMMLASNRYQPIWADLERWAGPKLERQWQLYLTEARARWQASRTADAAGPYLEALISAGRYSDVIADVYPIFRTFDPKEDYDLIFRVSNVARALGELGRWNEVRSLYATVDRSWPLGSDVNALNLTANESKYLLTMGEPAKALDLIDRTIAEAERHREQVNTDAVVGMHRVRVCVLHALGRDPEAAVSLAVAATTLDVESAVDLRLCIGDRAAAREAMLRAFASDATRDDAIALMQLDSTPPFQTPYGLKLKADLDALRNDPQILAALAKYGRRMPYAVNEAARFAPSPPAPKPPRPVPVTLNPAPRSPARG